MRFQSENNEELIIKLGEELAGTTLTRGIARLYSQHTKLQAGKDGLPSWKKEELYQRIGEAERLIVAALSLNDNERSNRYFRRAAEILEWTATINPNPSGIPTVILAAAAYQLGGYPARSLGVLSEHSITKDTSKVLEFFLLGNFPKTQEQLLLVFQEKVSLEREADDLPSVILDQVLRAIGVFISWIRWGDDERIETAMRVLENVAKAATYDIDTYSWLLATLIARITRKYKEDAIWEVTSPLTERMSKDGQIALKRYSKTAFAESKSLTWPSQRDGINGVISGESFALCTPTGSGKTRVAELAILQSLFPTNIKIKKTLDHEETIWDEMFSGDEGNMFSSILPPIVLYLAPSKALSSEVEANLARILSQIKADHISVTSMYGGNDIGPSDVLIAPEQPTVLISTHEKADALIRYLGIELFACISCVIIDEAHTVAFSGDSQELCNTESRSLRLETLVSRLKTICTPKTKFIALSAVASDIQEILSEWISATTGKKAIATQYRSTRQLLGQLQCYPDGSMAIQYDVLDGHRLVLENSEDSPYVPKPFPSHPKVNKAYEEDEGVEKKMRAHLLWAAMHFAVSSDEKKHSVLISITEHPEWYAETFLTLLESDWAEEKIPQFYCPPRSERNIAMMDRCLASCEDYFGKTSREYRLLKRGIVLHHGKMPLIMSRFLIELIQSHVVNIILATSTLSEGVNLPFETVLIPNIRRGRHPLPPREAINLMGRAGRPGVSTEGRSLVLLAANVNKGGQYISKIAYANIVETLTKSNAIGSDKKKNSPLLSLIMYIYSQWKEIVKDGTDEEFIEWLETVEYEVAEDNEGSLLRAVDTFDMQLLSAIEEMEQTGVSSNAEEFLKSLWRNTLSYYDSKQELVLEQVFARRGTALINSIYPDRYKRAQIYYTGLPPRDAVIMLDIIAEIKAIFSKAGDYLHWDTEQKVRYLIKIASLMGCIDSFSIPNLTTKITWQDVFMWWMAPGIATEKPTGKNVSKWYNFAAKHFVYKFNWALGSIISSILHRDGGTGTVLQQWSQAELPWVAIWFKDLITWGVLDPVASFVMAKKRAFTRKEAKLFADGYWNGKTEELEDSLFKPDLIYKWLKKTEPKNKTKGEKQGVVPFIGYEMNVELLEDFKIKPARTWQVLPADNGGNILWIDPAGFPLAKSKKPASWIYSPSQLMDFVLNPDELKIVTQSYI